MSDQHQDIDKKAVCYCTKHRFYSITEDAKCPMCTVSTLTAERDRLKARVAELEANIRTQAKVMTKWGMNKGERDRLKAENERLKAEVKSLKCLPRMESDALKIPDKEEIRRILEEDRDEL